VPAVGGGAISGAAGGGITDGAAPIVVFTSERSGAELVPRSRRLPFDKLSELRLKADVLLAPGG